MKILKLAIVLLLVSSCKENSKSSENINETEVEIQDSNSKINSANKNFIDKLQGTWERIDYPFDMVEFKYSEVKFTEGEGAIEEPEFEDFEISNNCPNAVSGSMSEIYLVRGEKCEKVNISNDTLLITYLVNNPFTIKYKKQQ